MAVKGEKGVTLTVYNRRKDQSGGETRAARDCLNLKQLSETSIQTSNLKDEIAVVVQCLSPMKAKAESGTVLRFKKKKIRAGK